jgi:RimK family alpha-L-glutamate ligase
MRVGILGKLGGWHTTALQAAWARRGIPAAVLPITRLTARLSGGAVLSAGEQHLDDFDLIFVRAIPAGSLEQIIFRMDALFRLEKAGVRVINSAKVIERTVDKYFTSWLLEQAGLPTPRTVVAERFEDALVAFHDLGGDVVVKPIFGSEGRGMVRVSDEDVAYRVFRALEMGHYVYYLQEFVPHGHRDVRVFVIGDRVEAAMVRFGESWKTNVAQGARPRHLEPDDQLQALALRATRAVGTDYAGIDILPTEDDGYMVIEINGIPGWRGLQTATGIDIADRLVDHVVRGAP